MPCDAVACKILNITPYITRYVIPHQSTFRVKRPLLALVKSGVRML